MEVMQEDRWIYLNFEKWLFWLVILTSVWPSNFVSLCFLSLQEECPLWLGELLSLSLCDDERPLGSFISLFFLLCSSLCFLIISIMACLPSPASGNVYSPSFKSVSTTYYSFLVFTWLFRNFRAGSSGNQIFFM